MKVKVSEASGPMLDWMVAKCEGLAQGQIAIDGVTKGVFNPSTNWTQGGPIIERECLDLCAYAACSAVPKNPDYWEARVNIADGETTAYGPTTLIAAMRCYVASKLGEEVEVPTELLKEN